MRWLGWLRRKPEPEETLPLDFSAYRGNWVAVKNGKLIAYEKTASELMDRFIALGDAARGATAWFEEHPENVWLWSVQYPDRPGYVCPNCIFKTRESAEAWDQPSWSGKESGIVFTRDGQHDPWRPAEPKPVLT